MLKYTIFKSETKKEQDIIISIHMGHVYSETLYTKYQYDFLKIILAKEQYHFSIFHKESEYSFRKINNYEYVRWKQQ